MTRFQKVSLALAAVGGTFMMAAPVAFADNLGGVNLSAAGSYQYQDGSNAYGAQMDQNSSVQAGQIQAENYYTNSNNFGSNGETTNYNSDGTMTSDQTNANFGGNSWTSADDYSSQGSNVSQNQSQNVGYGLGNGSSGGMQTEASLAVSGALGSNGLTGGVSGNYQTQNGTSAQATTLNQSSNDQAGLTQATDYAFSNNNYGSTSCTTLYNADGTMTSDVWNMNNGGNSYTTASDLSNPTASASQDQNQNVAEGLQGGTQTQVQGAAAGSLGNTFWGDVSLN